MSSWIEHHLQIRRRSILYTPGTRTRKRQQAHKYRTVILLLNDSSLPSLRLKICIKRKGKRMYSSFYFDQCERDDDRWRPGLARARGYPSPLIMENFWFFTAELKEKFSVLRFSCDFSIRFHRFPPQSWDSSLTVPLPPKSWRYPPALDGACL